MTHPLRTTLSSFLCIALLLSLSGTGLARDLPGGKPQREGMSPQRLERINDYMNQAVADGVMVGGMGMIARNGRIVFEETWGHSDREAGTPMTEDALFRIYSMTKPVTAVALMMLYEEGRFFLNDPVAKYLPELADLQVAVSTADSGLNGGSDGSTRFAAGSSDDSQLGVTRAPLRQPTIRDLLRHTAGFTYGIFGDTEIDRLYRDAALFESPKLEQFVTTLGGIPLQYEPGVRWHYSVSVDVQGRLVEVLSGMSFGEYLRQRIFEPLDMDDTFFVVPEKKMNRLTTLYSPEGASAGPNQVWQRSASTALVPADQSADRSFRSSERFESGGGGLISTTDDYMRFSLMMLNGGELNGKRLLSSKSVELMTGDHLAGLPVGWEQPGRGFGLGFAVVLDPAVIGELGSAGEYSWGGAAGTRFWIDPQEELVGIFMVQSLPHQTELGSKFRLLTYQAIVD